MKEIDIDRLVLNQPHHLHMERPKNYFFATYVLKETRNGSRILVCFQMNFDKIMALVDSRLRDLQDRFYVSVVDFEGNGVYGQPISRSSKYFFETRVPNTLYKWILQIVPRNYTELELGVRNQRRTNLFFIITSMSLIFITPMGRAGIGVGIRAGGRRFEIGTADALKQALLTARSVTFAREGASRPHLERMFERLGIAAEMQAKTLLEPGSGQAAEKVVAGEAEILLTLVSEILPVDGMELIGPLPREFQSYISFDAALGAHAADAAAARAFIDCIAAPATAPAFAAKGIER
jgi:hypothetical protein